MGAEEGQVRIGDRIDAGAHQLAALGPQLQVAAAEGDDPRLGRARRPSTASRSAQAPAQRTAKPASSVAPPVRAGDSSSPSPGAQSPVTSAPVSTVPPAARTSSAKAAATARKSTTPVLGRVQRRDAPRVRLDLGDLVRARGGAGRGPRSRAAALELVEARQLVLGGGDDQLAVAARLDPALVAVGVELARALDAEPRLERAGRVVDARRG